MKKALSLLMVVAMVLGFGSFTWTSAAAKAGDTDNQGAEYMKDTGNIKVAGLLKKAKEPAAEEPKAKEVIVQFEDSDAPDVNSAEAKKIETI